MQILSFALISDIASCYKRVFIVVENCQQCSEKIVLFYMPLQKLSDKNETHIITIDRLYGKIHKNPSI